MLYIISFLLLLGPLVFVHELGHFIFAKLFHVRVDVFSMGFGPKIFKKTWGETEYCLSIIPLGGYVKLFGQDPYEEIPADQKHRALNSLEPWKRFLVFIGGPLFNFLFAIFVFAFMLVLGEPHPTSRIGRVPVASDAYQLGFRAGDVIAAIDRNVITSFEEVHKTITEAPNKELLFRVKRQSLKKDSYKEIKATPKLVDGISLYGEPIEAGNIEGLFGLERAAVIGVSSANSEAVKAGLKSGDEIVSLNDKPVTSFEELERNIQELLLKKETKFLKLGIIPHTTEEWLSKKGESALSLQSPRPATKFVELPAYDLEKLGIHSSELFVVNLVNDSPAQKAGIQIGDRLVSINAVPLYSFDQLKQSIQKIGSEQKLANVQIERNGKKLSFEITPGSQQVEDIIGRPKTIYMIGIFPLLIEKEPEYFISRVLNPLTLTKESWFRSLDLSWKTLVSIKKLMFRQSSMNSLGGPLLIGKLAGDSMLRGLSQFLKVMAMISISLAVFNILPVPVLDGGHIFLLLVEVVRGKPISIRLNERVQTFGLSLIVLLLVVVLFNDITRVGIPVLKDLFQ